MQNINLQKERPVHVAHMVIAIALSAFALVMTLLDLPFMRSARGSEIFDWKIPKWLPPPAVPADNPMSAIKVELGRRLFYDKRLSHDGSMACATCHEQKRAFTEPRKTGVGFDGTHGKRNSMTLANAGYLPVLTWANPNLTALEVQALVPLFGDNPVEMGMAGREDILFRRLRRDPLYPPLFAKAFPELKGAISLATITRAIAVFQRTLISANSPYDRYKYGGDKGALSPAARRGEQLFFDHRLECYHCHTGFNFTDNMRHARSAFAEVGFHNTGLYNVGPQGGYPRDDPGLGEFTGERADNGKFRTPTLRNIAVTAPYMHDGSVATLNEAIDHYEAGGRKIAHGPNAGNGRDNPNRNPLVVGFRLTSAERGDLIAFLESLTDEAFLRDPRFANPWNEGPNAQPTDRERKFTFTPAER